MNPPVDPTVPAVPAIPAGFAAHSPSGVDALLLTGAQSSKELLATGGLASTGTDVSTMAALALLLTFGGLAMLFGSRRREV